MIIEVRNKNGVIQELSPKSKLVPVLQKASLFDLVMEKKSDGSGNYNLYLVMIRKWIQGANNQYTFSMQIAVTDGSPQGRLNLMKAYGYIA